MKTRRLSAKNDTSDNILNFKSPHEIPYDATCEILKFEYNLVCTHCIGKIDIFRKATSSKK